jgi:hypothetical protein
MKINMKDGKYFWGFLLVFIGVFWILENLGLISFSLWFSIFKLWPLILIVIGINIIFKDKGFVKPLSWLLFFVSIIIYGILQQSNYIVYEDLDNPNFILEMKPETELANLNLEINSGSLNINSENESLIKGYISNLKVKNKIDYKNDNKIANIYFESPASISPNMNKDKYDFELNKNVNWNVDLDIGVINGVLDFSDLKINNLDLDTGVGNVKVVFGTNSEYAKADIDTGISDIEIVLPENLGTRIMFDGGIKNTNLKNLNWTRSGKFYISPNYNDSKYKIDIYVNMGIGKLNIVTK